MVPEYDPTATTPPSAVAARPLIVGGASRPKMSTPPELGNARVQA